jgi:hypothetical protein
MASLLGSLMKKPDSKPAGAVPSESDCDLRLRLHRLIIDRYREEIEEHENKTVADLKSMIQPHEPIISKLRESLLEGFRPYIYQEHFLPALGM